MLIRALKHSKSAIGARVKEFGLAAMASPPFLARSSRLIFLCGANRTVGEPSARREGVKRFVEGLSPDIRVIYAEGVFTELSKIGHSKNVLDLEIEISAIADKIIIILESPSAFCELGAFSHQSLRSKLIIINNSEFEAQQSFINIGPIKAALEVKAPVIWYPMAPEGIHNLDGIGATFKTLKDSIERKPTTRSIRISGDISELTTKKPAFTLFTTLFSSPARLVTKN